MGFATDADLRRPPPDPLAPSPVGSIKGEFSGKNVTATLVVADPKTGAWDYGPEIRIHVTPNVFHDLPLDGEHILFWSGIEVTLNIPDLNLKRGRRRGKRGDPYFVVASLASPETPEYPLGWFACAQLRSKINISSEKNNEAIRKAILEDGLQLRDLPRDPFLTDGGSRDARPTDKGRLAARLDDPMRLHYAHGQDLGNGFVTGPKTTGAADAVWHFGICPESFLLLYRLRLDQPASSIRTPAGPRTGAVKMPPMAMSLRDAKLWHALAGRADADDVTQPSLLAKAIQDARESHAREAGRS